VSDIDVEKETAGRRPNALKESAKQFDAATESTTVVYVLIAPIDGKVPWADIRYAIMRRRIEC
jgi:hypothetical protein